MTVGAGRWVAGTATPCPPTPEKEDLVPEGALLTNTVEAALVDLAASGSTGCLVVRDQEGDEAEVYLRDGQVYAVMVPGGGSCSACGSCPPGR